jgi:hypothetical protein
MIHKTWLDEKSTQPHHVRVRISEPMFAKGKAESKRSHMNNLQRAEETHPGADHLSIVYGHFDLFSTHCEVRPVLIERPMMHCITAFTLVVPMTPFSVHVCLTPCPLVTIFVSMPVRGTIRMSQRVGRWWWYRQIRVSLGILLNSV